jgi:hypothetical protein
VYYLVYVSAAVTWFSEAELRALLTGARFRNENADITGMLLYKDGNFMQALEGSEAAVLDRIGAERLDRVGEAFVREQLVPELLRPPAR